MERKLLYRNFEYGGTQPLLLHALVHWGCQQDWNFNLHPSSISRDHAFCWDISRCFYWYFSLFLQLLFPVLFSPFLSHHWESNPKLLALFKVPLKLSFRLHSYRATPKIWRCLGRELGTYACPLQSRHRRSDILWCNLFIWWQFEDLIGPLVWRVRSNRYHIIGWFNR